MTEFNLAWGPVTVADCVAVFLSVASLFISIVAVRQMRARLRAVEERPEVEHSPCMAVRTLQESLAGQKDELRELRESAPVPANGVQPRSGMNLNKRSHVLRLHRRGDSPQQIATQLDIPLQEVDLLIKVHRIVLSSV